MIYNITRYLNILAIICYNEKQHRELDNTSKERNQCGTILRANPNPSRLSLETAPSCSQVSLLARLPSSQSRRTPLRHLCRPCPNCSSMMKCSGCKRLQLKMLAVTASFTSCCMQD